MGASTGTIIAVVLEVLSKILPQLTEYIRSLIDGGATAEELRSKAITFSIAFGGGEGKVIEVLKGIEADLTKPE